MKMVKFIFSCIFEHRESLRFSPRYFKGDYYAEIPKRTILPQIGNMVLYMGKLEVNKMSTKHQF